MGCALVNTAEVIRAAQACIADIESERLNDWNNAIARQMKERKFTWRFWRKETYTEEEARRILSDRALFGPASDRYKIFTYRHEDYRQAKQILAGARICQEDTIYLSLAELALLKPYWPQWP